MKPHCWISVVIMAINAVGALFRHNNHAFLGWTCAMIFALGNALKRDEEDNEEGEVE